MKTSHSFATVAAVSLAVVLVPAAAVAGGPPLVVPATVSGATDRASVQVVVAQSEIGSNINPSMIAVATGGGLLGGLLAAAQNSAREKKAEELIGPIRTTLTGFDGDAAARNAAQAGLQGAAWLDTAGASFAKDNTPVGESAYLDTASAPRVMFVDYVYDFGPEFDSVRVVARFALANKAALASPKAKPEDRLKAKNLVWTQSITSVVQLPGSTKEKEENAARLAADNGVMVKSALDQAFAKITELTPRALSLTQADVTAMKDKTRRRFGYQTLQGRVVEEKGGETLFWANGFVNVQPLK